jgi:hypothetical protein
MEGSVVGTMRAWTVRTGASHLENAPALLSDFWQV